MDTPRMSRVSHRHSRINTKPVSVSGPQMRGYRCLIPSIPTLLLCEVSRHIWNIADTFRRQDVPSRRTRSVNKPSTVKTAVLQQRHETTRQDSEHTRLRHPMGGSWMMERGVVTTYMAVLPSRPPTRSCNTSGMLRILTGTRECLPDRYAVPTN